MSGKSRVSKGKTQNTKGKNGKYDTSDPSSYIGTWKYHFKEDDENSDGYIITFTPQMFTASFTVVQVSEFRLIA